MAATTTDSEVREVVERMLDAMNRGDRERLRSCLSEGAGAVHIGTDPDEWWSSAQVVETTGGGGPSGIQVVTDEVTVHLLGENLLRGVAHEPAVQLHARIAVRILAAALAHDAEIRSLRSRSQFQP